MKVHKIGEVFIDNTGRTLKPVLDSKEERCYNCAFNFTKDCEYNSCFEYTDEEDVPQEGILIFVETGKPIDEEAKAKADREGMNELHKLNVPFTDSLGRVVMITKTNEITGCSGCCFQRIIGNNVEYLGCGRVNCNTYINDEDEVVFDKTLRLVLIKDVK